MEVFKCIHLSSKKARLELYRVFVTADYTHVRETWDACVSKICCIFLLYLAMNLKKIQIREQTKVS